MISIKLGQKTCEIESLLDSNTCNHLTVCKTEEL